MAVLGLCLLLWVLLTEPAIAAPSESHDGVFPSECAEEDEVLPVQLLQQGMVLEGPGQPHAERHISLIPTTIVISKEGNVKASFGLMLASASGVIILSFFFCILRVRHPLVYSNNVVEGIAPKALPNTLLGWLGPTLTLTVDEVAENVSLDVAMLLEYSHLCMKIFLNVGIQVAAFVGTVKLCTAKTTGGHDFLTQPFMGAAKSNYFYWAHGFLVFSVVMVVTRHLHAAMQKFLPRRVKWLREMPELHANTVLVEGIPEEFQSEERLKRFFEDLLPGAVVRSLSLCKETTDLEVLVRHYDKAGYNLKAAEAQWAKAFNSADCRPLVRHAVIGSKIEAIPFWKNQQTALLKHIGKERVLIEQDQSFLSSGFVTFMDRSSAEILLRMEGLVSSGTAHWKLDTAPEPGDILWHDLTQDDSARGARTAIGYLVSTVLFLFYLPIVLGVANVAKLIDFERLGLHALQGLWANFTPAMGLIVVIGFLPMALSLIFQLFFTVKSTARLQHKIQVWYFWFQVVLVIFVAAVGQSFRPFAGVFTQDSPSVFSVLAEAFPQATFFYMNFLALQWLAHSFDLTRCLPLMRFKSARVVFADEDARRVAEPEDQDPWGIGSRSAVWAMVTSIGLIFGTLCPLMNVLAFIDFAICRVVYGYLMCFAETKKPDLGGVYWVTKLQHTFAACIVYATLMTVVLAHQAASYGPALLAAAGLGWAMGSRAKFGKYQWDRLPIDDFVRHSPGQKRPDRGQYVQPELLEPKA